MKKGAAIAGLLGALSAADARPVRAGLVVYDREAWTVTLDGRAQGFYSFAHGDAAPVPDGTTLSEPPIAAVGDDAGRVNTSRVRGGWAGTMFGVTTQDRLSDTLTATARVSFWFTVEGDQTKGAPNDTGSLDIRQGYVKLDSTSWGGVLFGRQLGLHSRGSLLQAAVLTSDDYGVGSPCGVTGLGLTCGQVGYGVLMPGFNAGIVYNTPELGGLSVSVGAYDPVRIGPDGGGPTSYGQTPLPRFEAEAVYHHEAGPFRLHLFTNGMWQRAVETGGHKAINPAGIGAGGRAGWAGLTAGLVGGWDKGGGLYVPLGDVQIDATGELRTVTTLWGQAQYQLGPAALTAGLGRAHANETPADRADPTLSVIDTHAGLNAAVMYHLGPVMLVAQYFRMHHTWHRAQHQTLHIINTGATFNW